MSSTGGDPTSAEPSPFGVKADDQVSRWEHYKVLFDEWVYAPGKIILSDWRGAFGLAIVLLYVLMGTVGIMLVPNPTQHIGPRLLPWFTDLEYPFGTDNMSKDLFGMVVYATPPMLKMILSGGVFATSVATIVGTVSGYKGGRTDRILMVLTDVMLTIPGLPLVIVLAVALEPTNPFVIGLLLTVNAWAGLARAVRSQVLTIREESYVEAARALGLSTPKIIQSEIIPNIMPYILINFVQTARGVIFNSVGLYFLGILPFSTLNWGVMLNEAYQAGALSSTETMHWIFTPMIVITILSLGLILLSQSLDRIFNPRVRARHEKTSTGEVPQQ